MTEGEPTLTRASSAKLVTNDNVDMKDATMPGEVLIKRQFHEMKDAESDVLDSQEALEPPQSYRGFLLDV